MDVTRLTEVDAKHERVRRLLDAQDLDGLLLLSAGYIGWFTDGGHAAGWDAHTEPSLAVLVTRRERFLLVTPDGAEASLRIEAGDLGLHYVPVLPQTSALLIRAGRLAAGSRLGADVLIPETRHILGDVTDVSVALRPEETRRLRELGYDLAVAVTHCCLHARHGTTGHQVAGILSGCMVSMGISVVRIAATAFPDDQPDGGKYGKEARVRTGFRLEVCGRRGGLHAALARTVTFGPLPTDEYGEHVRGRRWVALLASGTRAGARCIDPVSDSWEILGADRPPPGASFLPVGGPCGYRFSLFAHRERLEQPFHAGETVVWRSPGWVSGDADTFLITKGGLDCVTVTPDLPVEPVVVGTEVVHRPGLVVR